MTGLLTHEYAAGLGRETSETRSAGVGGPDPCPYCLQLLEPKVVDPLELTPEQEAEYAQRAKEYSRRMMHEHRIWQADLSRKLQLKKVRPVSAPIQRVE